MNINKIDGEQHLRMRHSLLSLSRFDTSKATMIIHVDNVTPLPMHGGGVHTSLSFKNHRNCVSAYIATIPQSGGCSLDWNIENDSSVDVIGRAMNIYTY